MCIRVDVKELNDLIGVENRVLDHGFVRLIDYMGNDSSIVQGARVSYGDGTKSVSSDKALLRYLVKHKHHSPLELCNIKFHIKLPIFVMRQLVRHRIASINEYSGRYSIMDTDFYIPDLEHINEQSKVNNQGRGEPIDINKAKIVQKELIDASQNAYNKYMELIKSGNDEDINLSREIARIILPVNFYTQCYWSINARSLLNFLMLRLDLHAQYEIQEYARVIYDLFKKQCPILCEAFEDYIVNSMDLSSNEIQFIESYLKNGVNKEQISPKYCGLSHREYKELCIKLQKLYIDTNV